MQKNNKKMTCLAAILMAALAALLIFAIVDANRINRSLSELQQTVNYEERLEPLLFYGATAETAETAATAETAKTLEPELNFTVTKSGIVPDDGSYVPVTLGDVTVCIPVAAAGQGGCTVTYCSGNSTAAIGDYKIALVEGNTEDSVVTFQNDDKEILSGTRTMGEGLTLTVAAEAEEGFDVRTPRPAGRVEHGYRGEIRVGGVSGDADVPAVGVEHFSADAAAWQQFIDVFTAHRPLAGHHKYLPADLPRRAVAAAEQEFVDERGRGRVGDVVHHRQRRVSEYVVIAVIPKSNAVLRCIGRSLHLVTQDPVRFPGLVSRLPDISTVIVLQLSKGRQCCIIHDKGCFLPVRTLQGIHKIQHIV